MTPVSRTIGVDRVVDEMVFEFTHTIKMDWMLPGVEPTGKHVRVALVVIVHFRDGKLAHEHIYWDQASVLAQLGLIDAQKLPVAGVESAEKVLNPGCRQMQLMNRIDMIFRMSKINDHDKICKSCEAYVSPAARSRHARIVRRNDRHPDRRGIFQVTSQAWAITGPSVILGYLVLTPAILATSIPYAAYLSTPLGREPGGEYLHISRTLKGFRLAYVGSWLKIISYIGAGAYLANAMAGYLIALSGNRIDASDFTCRSHWLALVVFYLIHVIGIRWFGRMQVVISALKCLALLVLIVPGLFVFDSSNYTPFFTHGWRGFGASLLPLFFAYAGFRIDRANRR